MSDQLCTSGSIANEIYERLRGILMANGCETDVGINVMRGRLKIPGDDEPPCIQIIEGQDAPQSRPGRVPQVLISQPYVIDAFDRCDPDNPNDKAHAMARDIKRAIFSDGTTLGGRVKSCDYVGRDIGPRPDGAALVQLRLMIAVEYVETLAEP